MLVLGVGILAFVKPSVLLQIHFYLRKYQRSAYGVSPSLTSVYYVPGAVLATVGANRTPVLHKQ